MKILYLFVSPRKEKERLYDRGEYPDTLFYGLNHLRKLGHKVDYFDDAFLPGNPWKYICWPIARLVYLLTGYGFKLDQAISLFFKFKKYDVVVTCGSSAGLPLALLKSLRLLRKPVVCIHMGGAEKLSNTIIINIFKRLYCKFDRIVVLARSEGDLLKNVFGLISGKVVFCPLGIDANFFTPGKVTADNYFLSVGRDLNRDYSRLINIFKTLPYKLKVVTSRRNIVGLNLPINVEVIFDMSYVELREAYKKCSAVVLAIQPTDRAAGQLVFLEALAMNKKVITTNSNGLTSGYDDLKQVCVMVNNGDDDDFVSKIRDVANDTKNHKLQTRDLIVKKYRSEIMANNLLKILFEVVKT